MSDLTPQLQALANLAESSLPPVSVDDLLANSDPSDIGIAQAISQRPSRRHERQGRSVPILMAASVALVLAVGLGWLVTRSDTGAREVAVAPPLASQLTVPTDRPVILRNDGSPIGEQLAALDLDGYLIAVVDGRPLVYDLETGDEVDAPDARRIGEGWIGVEGILHRVERFGGRGEQKYNYEVVFSPWDGPDIPLGIEGFPIATSDPDVGLIAIVGQSSPDSSLPSELASQFPLPSETYIAHVVTTGERRPLGLAPQLADEFFYTNAGMPLAPAKPRPLRMEKGGEIYEWTWTDGWKVAARGRLVLRSSAHDVVEHCETLDTCTRSLLNSAGEAVADLSGDPSVDSMMVADSSPAGRFAQLAPTGNVLRVFSTDGESTEYQLAGSSYHEVAWVGDEHVLLTKRSGPPLLFDVSTGESTALDFLVRAAGTQPEFLWLPELAGGS